MTNGNELSIRLHEDEALDKSLQTVMLGTQARKPGEVKKARKFVRDCTNVDLRKRKKEALMAFTYKGYKMQLRLSSTTGLINAIITLINYVDRDEYYFSTFAEEIQSSLRSALRLSPFGASLVAHVSVLKLVTGELDLSECMSNEDYADAYRAHIEKVIVPVKQKVSA